MTALPAVGTPIAMHVERMDGAPAGVRVRLIGGYTVAGLGGVSHRAACSWHAADTERDTPAARVWAILTDQDGRRCGQYRAADLWPRVDLAAELAALELAVTRDLAELDAIR